MFGLRIFLLNLKSLAYFNKSELHIAAGNGGFGRERVYTRERSKLSLVNAERAQNLRRWYCSCIVTVVGHEIKIETRGAFDPRRTAAYRVWIVKRSISAQLIGASLILQNGDNSSDGPYN